MKIHASTHSNFPRVGDDAREQRLRRSYADLEKAKISVEDYKKIQDDLIDEIILIQKNAGIDFITDGLIRWYDPASHLAKHLKGFDINGLLRFFDTNTYYRQPVARGNFAVVDDALASEIKYTCTRSEKPVKAVILGPYSMAKMSLNSTNLKFDDFCLKLAEIIAKLANDFSVAGAEVIQIEEPAFIREPQNFELLRKCISTISASKNSAKLLLSFYFGDCGKVLDELATIPADIFGFDFTYSPGLIDKLSSNGFPKPIAFGIIDGRNTKMESAEAIAKLLEKPLKKIGKDGCQITSSCGLEYLPRNYAIKKLELTAKVANLLNG